MEIKIKGFQHLGIPVTHLERSAAFYKGLGFENVMASDFVTNGEKGVMAMMQRGDMIIEIYQLPASLLGEIKTRKDGHIDHIAFDVDDVDTVFETLKSNGYQVIEPAPVFLPFWQNGCKYFNITGPDGERLEFNQIL
jgi:lactoylglutathione lyase